MIEAELLGSFPAEDGFAEAIGRHLQRAMVRRRRTVESLARQLAVSERTVWRVLLGQHTSAELVDRLSMVLRVDWEADLTGGAS